ncbi:unnamed protein product [Lepeophtheirus salmonis]|uniref:(salmon louse) hypothetical protein n=1 Tax=Lepeophtheirus salmonis TaxID=72036 RepID=A0A7R8HC83_LEPSM|nr:unnamed protein product [Lepeophtheirus salmonis]CAF3008123.1 unnamed protein product [Lepeophtheirus salmonis]
MHDDLLKLATFHNTTKGSDIFNVFISAVSEYGGFENLSTVVTGDAGKTEGVHGVTQTEQKHNKVYIEPPINVNECNSDVDSGDEEDPSIVSLSGNQLLASASLVVKGVRKGDIDAEQDHQKNITNPRLLRLLKENGIAATGTFRANRTENAPLIAIDEMKKGSRGISDVVNDNQYNATLVRWKDNKEVTVASILY